MPDYYTNPLSLTSQFFFCGLPLRLDSYRGCAFQCTFCYARYRGGNTSGEAVLPADPNTLQRIFERAFHSDRPAGIVGQFLRQRVPVHFGGMSDPFQPAERSFGITRRFLETLLEFQHPLVISTRSTMPMDESYLALLRQMKSVVVQFSFSSTRADVSNRLEPHSPNPKDLLRTMERLSACGITTTARWQPYVPKVSETPNSFMRCVAATGAKHVALEHLKLPVESKNPLWSKLLDGARRDLRADYAAALRNGRELVLPHDAKLPTILEARRAAHDVGVSFGAADNEFQYLSDTDCCCSGVDQFPGFGGWFKHQVAYAVRRCRGLPIVYGAIASFWTPDGSVERWLNSHSRLGSSYKSGGTIEDHIRIRWNDPASQLSPGSFYGVEPTEEFTASGFRVYRWREEARTLFKFVSY